MEKAIKNKVSKAVVPAIDVMFQAVRYEGVLLCELPWIPLIAMDVLFDLLLR
jgi:hypothetical protein